MVYDVWTSFLGFCQGFRADDIDRHFFQRCNHLSRRDILWSSVVFWVNGVSRWRLERSTQQVWNNQILARFVTEVAGPLSDLIDRVHGY